MYRFWVEYTDLGHLEKTEKRPEDLGRKLDADGFEDVDARGFILEVDENIVAEIAEPDEYGHYHIERDVFKHAMLGAYDRCQEISRYYTPTSIELISC